MKCSRGPPDPDGFLRSLVACQETLADHRHEKRQPRTNKLDTYIEQTNLSSPLASPPAPLLVYLLLTQEWGDDHEAEAVMHLRTPMLSAAVAMGIGGITTVHQVALSSLRLDGTVGW